jgi:uncharacterized membrane protein YkvA (DUF1232 family)
LKFFRELIEFLRSTSNDERIPARDKKILLALVALIISPVDLIPDWIPILGQLDDLVMISLVLDYFFRVLDSTVLLSHFPWSMKSFARLRALARFTSFLVPGFLKKRLWRYVGEPY